MTGHQMTSLIIGLIPDWKHFRNNEALIWCVVLCDRWPLVQWPYSNAAGHWGLQAKASGRRCNNQKLKGAARLWKPPALWLHRAGAHRISWKPSSHRKGLISNHHSPTIQKLGLFDVQKPCHLLKKGIGFLSFYQSLRDLSSLKIS